MISDEIVLPQIEKLLYRVYGNKTRYYRVDEYYLSLVPPVEVTMRMLILSEDGVSKTDELFTFIVSRNRRCRLVDIHSFRVGAKVDYAARPDAFRTNQTR